MSNAKPPDEKNTQVTPPPTEEAKTEAPKVETPPAVAKTEAPKVEAKTETPKEVTVGADGDIPEGDLVKMPRKALDDRLARASKAELKALFEEFGVKDKDDLKARIAKLKDVEAKEEQQRLANLTETDRLKEEKAASDAKAKEWQDRYEQRVQTEEMTKVQEKTSTLLSTVLDPDVVDVMLPKLGAHLVAKYTDKEMENLSDDVILDWAKEQVAKKPKLGKDFTAEAKPAIEKQKLTTTTKTETPPPKKEGDGPKNYAPQKGETPEQRRQITSDLRAKGINF